MSSTVNTLVILTVAVLSFVFTEAGDALDEEKRGWKDNNLVSWGKRDDDKRGWKSSKFESWGKRDDEDDKRGWKNSKFESWGKRDDDDKRGWKNSKFESWGKRGWADNSLHSWGKRVYDSLRANTDDSGKRTKWQDSGFRSWGKRSVPMPSSARKKRSNISPDILQALERKRILKKTSNWMNNALRSWG